MIFISNNQNKLNRPDIRPEPDPIDWILEAFAIIGLLIFAGYVIYQYPRIPGRIPVHFNGAGMADESGDRTNFLMLPGIALFTYVLLTLINLVPQRFNFPGKITPENALRQYTLAMRLIRYFKLIFTVLFLYICISTVNTAKHTSDGLGIWFLPVFLSITFLPILIYFILSRRKI